MEPDWETLKHGATEENFRDLLSELDIPQWPEENPPSPINSNEVQEVTISSNHAMEIVTSLSHKIFRVEEEDGGTAFLSINDILNMNY